MKYRKKPIVVDAVQWFKNGDHPEDYLEWTDGFENEELVEFSPEYQQDMNWEGQLVRYYRNPDDDGARPCTACDQIMHRHGWIETAEGGHIVCPGDYIITGVQGERYPCKPSIFEATY